MILDLNFKIKDFDGNESEIFAYKALSSILCTKAEGLDVDKVYNWVLDLRQNKFLEVDKVDLEKIESFLRKQAESKDGIFISVWGQLNEAIKKAKELKTIIQEPAA